MMVCARCFFGNTKTDGILSVVRLLGMALLLVWSLRVAADAPAPALAGAEIAADPGGTTIDEPEAIRIYKTPAERREAGLRTEIAPWLTVYGLAEAELYYDDFEVERGRDSDSGRDDVVTLQLGLVVDLFELADAEAILEYATDTDKVIADEAFITFEHSAWALALGKQYTPFGVYFSNFASDPIIEFGETRSNEVAKLSLTPAGASQLSLALYRGRAKKRHEDGDDWNWVGAAEIEISEDWSVGLSYQSDLADAGSRPLQDDGNRYARRVPGISGYFLWADEAFAASFEIVAATRSYAELDRDRNQPSAWNAEVVRFLPSMDLELAVRFEGSHELEDAPEYQYGAALIWSPRRYASLTLEYLHGEFKKGLATSAEDEPYTHVDHVGAKLSIEF